MSQFDVIIVGGGIAGASLGAAIAGRRTTLIVEAEDQCGVHSTGRSAAFFLESYGGPEVARLTVASREFLDQGYLRTRGDLHLTLGDLPVLPDGIESRIVERPELEAMVPGIRDRWRRALFEPGCADIDVASLHANYLRQFRQSGGMVRTGSRVRSARNDANGWTVDLADGSEIRASLIVNAAGAWADAVAAASSVQTLGIAPKRRTMVQLRVGRSGLRDLPLIDDAAGTFYFKGEGDNSLWLSPHDEIPTEACDAAPEEIDVAVAIDRFERVVDWPVERVERSWAGLRSFARDRLPVYGFDRAAPNFFWCAGQGGFGIQTSPAGALLCAALLLGEEPSSLSAGIDPTIFSPRRF